MGTTQPFGSNDLTAVLDAMHDGIQVIDREWRYVFLNRAAAEQGGRPREELIGRTLADCQPGLAETEVFALLHHCMEKRVSRCMIQELEHPGGRSRVLELRVEPCEAGIVILSIDVTDGRKLEDQLRHAQKMEAVGRLAGSVAHDFNNLLSVILSYSVMLAGDLGPMDPMRADLEAIRRAGERAAHLTRQLLLFSRQQVVAPRLVDLNEVVKESEKMVRRLLGEDIEIVTRCERQLFKVRLEPAQIDQVMINLALNARDAMPRGGTLTIETTNVLLDPIAHPPELLGVKSGPHVMLAVSDTGVGMDRATQARIFEPFFTTKEKGKGTGLGLATVFGIVQQSGGNIGVQSEPGKGTTFKIHLPKAEEL